MPAPFQFAGRTAVITGAASGIGAALARNLAARGCRLALVDIDRAGLETLASALPPAQSSVHVMDVSDAAGIAALPAAVEAAHGGAALLFNNAGVALGGRFEEVTAADFDWLMAINFTAVVGLTRAFLPSLRQQDQAQIINISSLFGLIAPAGQTAYCASKFAVRGFSDSLRHELAGSPVGVTTVHPGGINTAIARNARQSPGRTPQQIAEDAARSGTLLVMPPERAAEIILRGVARRAPRILVGRDAHMMALLERVFPVRYWSLINRRVQM